MIFNTYVVIIALWNGSIEKIVGRLMILCEFCVNFFFYNSLNFFLTFFNFSDFSKINFWPKLSKGSQIDDVLKFISIHNIPTIVKFCIDNEYRFRVDGLWCIINCNERLHMIFSLLFFVISSLIVHYELNKNSYILYWKGFHCWWVLFDILFKLGI